MQLIYIDSVSIPCCVVTIPQPDIRKLESKFQDQSRLGNKTCSLINLNSDFAQKNFTPMRVTDMSETDMSETDMSETDMSETALSVSDSSSISSTQYCRNAPQPRQRWIKNKQMMTESNSPGRLRMIPNGKKIVETRRRSPRKHSGSVREVESVLVSAGKPEGGRQHWQQEAGRNEPDTGSIKETLQFDDCDWAVLSKRYLPTDVSIKRDHAVAYLGPGAQEEEIQQELSKMKNLDKQLVSFGNWAVRRIMLDNFHKSRLTREHNGKELAVTFDDVKNRWKNWDIEKEPELAEIYYNNIVGWFDVNKTWLEKTEKDFLSNKHYKWKEDEEVKRMKGHRAKMNFIQERFAKAKTAALKEISRVSKDDTSHGYYVNGSADRDKVPATYRKKPGEFHMAYLHNWNKNGKHTAPPIATHKPIAQPDLQNRNGNNNGNSNGNGKDNTDKRPPPAPATIKEKREVPNIMSKRATKKSKKKVQKIKIVLMIRNCHALTIFAFKAGA